MKCRLFLMFLVTIALRMLLAPMVNLDDQILLGFSLLGIGIIVLSSLKRPLTGNLFLKLFSFFYFCYFLFILIVLYLSGDPKLLKFIVERSFSTVLVTGLIFILLTGLSNQNLRWILSHFSLLTLPIVAMSFILNNLYRKYSFEFYRSEDVIAMVFENGRAISNQRTLGVLINLENSSVLMSMLFIFFFFNFMVFPFSRDNKTSRLGISLSLLGLLGVISSTSVSVISVCALLTAFGTGQLVISMLRLNRFKLWHIIITVPLVIATCAGLSSQIFNLIDRFLTYWKQPELLFSKMFAESGDSWGNFFINSKILEGQSNGFGINEMHIFTSLKFLGLVPTLCWYVVFFSPLYFAFYWTRYLSFERSVFLMMLAGFLSSLHYAGIVAWPNNIIFCLGFVILYRRVVKPKAAYVH